MALNESLPESVQAALSELSVAEENTKLAVSSDIDGDGRFGERWLVVTSDRAYVFLPNGSHAKLLADVPLADIEEAKAEYLVGNGVLHVKVNGRRVELLHYTNSLAPKFHRVARQLEAIAKEEETPQDDEEEKKHCETCGRYLPDGTSVCPACLNKGRVLRRLLSLTRPYWSRVVIVAVLMLAGTAIDLAPPWLTKILTDDVLLNRGGHPTPVRFRMLAYLILCLIALRIVGTANAIIRSRLNVWLGSKMVTDIRSELYQTLQRLSLSYFDKRQIGSVMARVTQDTSALQGFVVDGPQYVVSLLNLVGICVVLFLVNWRLALWVLIPTPLVGTLSAVYAKRMFRAYHKFWHSLSRMSAVLNDALSGIRVIRAFAQEDREVNRFGVRNTAVFDATMYAEQFAAAFWPTMAFLTAAGGFIVWWVGGKGVIAGNIGGQEFTLGMLMAFLSYLGMFYGPLQVLTRITEWVTRCLTATERIFEVLDTDPEIADAPDAVRMPDIRGEIEFRNVTFGYESYKPVLHNIDLHIKAGEMIGLVGHSGAGKTTLINLICRFYDPTEGQVLIDGVDARKICLQDFRRQIGVVLQEPFLFNGTVADNIAYAKKDATREEIIRAAKAANAHDFIMKLPDGYDSQVGERGGRLSGGERQRISIARAILHDPKILILDEATTSVDTETEKQIQDALARLVKNRTTFAIAHRLSTLRNSDRLLVLDKGRIAEIGTHDELLERKGVYHRLVEMQTELSKMKAVDG